MKKLIYARITGSTINEQIKALSHEVVAYPSNTYHKFVLENGAVLWFNDFGVRSVVIADSPEKLN